MNSQQANLNEAVSRHQSGDLAGAEQLYRAALDRQPNHWDALYLLGTVLLQQGRWEESASLLQRVVNGRPDIPDAQNNLGIAYKALGRHEDAARAFQGAIQANPHYDQAFCNFGSLMEDQGRYADAEPLYARAHALSPNDVSVSLNLGNVRKALGQWHNAELAYRHALACHPTHRDALVNLAFVLAKQERLQDAAEIYQTILDARPDFFQIHSSLSYVLERHGRLEQAVASAQRALEIAPDYAEAHNNLGIALRSLHQLPEASACFQQAMTIDPQFGLAEFNFATTKLLQGYFKEGWLGYERRDQAGEIPLRRFPAPRWDGSSISGKTLLVYADQGFGDTLQFVRFLEQVRDISEAHVILECQPALHSLLAGIDGVDELATPGGTLPHIDAHIPLASLPGLLHIELETIPATVPYLQVPDHLGQELCDRIAVADSTHLKVGIVWQGNPRQRQDIARSLPLEKLLPLGEMPHVTLFSLQTGDGAAAQTASLPEKARMIDLGSELHDFADTAACLARLDLLVTVDTAAAHLAGALGVPVWTMLSHTPDWRWLLDRIDSPWYPTMRLFRQSAWGDWDSVVQSVHAELAQVRH